MTRSLSGAVNQQAPSKFAAVPLPAVPRSHIETTQTLDHIRPHIGNLTPSESWRRMLGGRKRYNHGRQQAARARRDAILLWLIENRMNVPCEVLDCHVPMERIVVRHGDGAMLAKALGVGKATACRDLSAIQAANGKLFGIDTAGISYEEYMAGWKYAHRTGAGNSQPKHNLRHPRNQNGPVARTRKAVAKSLGPDRLNSGSHKTFDSSYRRETVAKQATSTEATVSTESYLTTLRKNCPAHEFAPPELRILAQSLIAAIS